MATRGARRESAASSRQEQTNLRVILDTTTDGIVVVDNDGIICFVNRAAEALFGRDASDLLGDVFGFPLVAGTTVELDVVNPRGENHVVEMRVAPIVWERRNACLASLRDITDRKQAEAEREALMREQVARAEAEAAIRARDEFLAATAHELKTPLTRLRLALQRAKRRVAREAQRPPDHIEEALRQIDLESEQIVRLVDDLLRLPWIEQGAFEVRRAPTDLCGLVRTVVARVRGRTIGDRVRVRTPSGPVVASVDHKLLEQLLASAIANALRVSPADQPIDVELSIPPGESPGEGSGVATLSVRDYGTPVPLEDPPRLFGRSFQVYSNAYASGLGVWLYVGHEVARLHGGRIDVEYPPDGGTLVAVTLPLA